MSKITKVEDAVKLIHDGDTISSVGGQGTLTPVAVLRALEARFLAEGHPRNLTLFETTPITIGSGFEPFSHEGFLKRLIVSVLSHESDPKRLEMIAGNKVEAYTIPFGISHKLFTEIAKKSPGVLTEVGLHSFVDPRVEGGKCNSISTADMIKVVEFEGKEWLLYKTFPINVAIIRGTTADEDGNISLEQEGLTQAVLYQAMAAKNCGGKVIAQVKRVMPRGSIDPRMVLVPGVLVDAIVVAEEQWQHERFPGQYDPGIDGRVRVSPPPALLQPLDADKVVARRTAMEIKAGQVVTLGGGIPVNRVTHLTLEEDIQDLFVISREHGTLGGFSYGREVHINPTSWFSYEEVFNWYSGGGMDLGLLQFLQVDKEGNVNLSRLGKVFHGPGGAPATSHFAKKLIYTGTFTQGGLRVNVGGGKIAITEEGKNRRFVNRLEQVTVDGKFLAKQEKTVLFVTERAVFQLTKDGLELIEIAPGIDLEKDILGQMEYKPLISNSLREMEPRIFRDELMGLRRDMLGYEEKGRKRPVPLLPPEKLPRRPYWTAQP